MKGITLYAARTASVSLFPVSTHSCACVHMPIHQHSHHLLRASAVLMAQALQLYLKTSSKYLF